MEVTAAAMVGRRRLWWVSSRHGLGEALSWRFLDERRSEHHEDSQQEDKGDAGEAPNVLVAVGFRELKVAVGGVSREVPDRVRGVDGVGRRQLLRAHRVVSDDAEDARGRVVRFVVDREGHDEVEVLGLIDVRDRGMGHRPHCLSVHMDLRCQRII